MSSKSPTLFLRQSAVIDVTKTWQPGKFIEIGAGTGQMTRLFLSKKGFAGSCYDLSPESRRILIDRTKGFGDRLQVLSAPPDTQQESYDYLLAFEVLEHIENDLETLKYWSKFVKTGGRIIVSVPAHKNKFSKIDEIVGHVRRYEKTELVNLLGDAGFHNIKIINYGYPLTNISRSVSRIILRKDDTFKALPVAKRNLQSSYTRPPIISSYLSKTPENLFIPFKLIQRWFYRYDFGDGLIATAEKPHSRS